MSENDLLDGFAQTLEDAAVGVWRSDGTPYLAAETAIVVGGMPQSPVACIALATYGPSDDHPDMAIGVRRVQVRVRAGSYRAMNDLADACFTALHGLTHRQWGDVHANEVLRISSSPLGQDGSKNWERTDNFAVEVDLPPTALRPN